MKKKPQFTPNPIDTSDITLSKDLLELSDKLAENVHNVWAKGRIDEGWTYSQTRSFENKTTPLLVPYDELGSKEKEYDINTSLETLKYIIKLGYKIEKK